MKKLGIGILLGILAALCIGLTSCMWPEVLPDDPVGTPLMAAFSYYPTSYPVQTDSRILFDGSASEGNIIWAEWNFMDGVDEEDRQDGAVNEGPWTKVVSRWENGVEILETVSVRREVAFTYDDIIHLNPDVNTSCYYTVSLTIWDDEGNSAATSRRIKVTNK